MVGENMHEDIKEFLSKMSEKYGCKIESIYVHYNFIPTQNGDTREIVKTEVTTRSKS